MFDNLLKSLGLKSTYGRHKNRTFTPVPRKEKRHAATSATVSINGEMSDLRDWSMKAISFDMPFRLSLEEGQRVKFLLTFPMAEKTIEVSQKGHVLRAARNNVVITFKPDEVTQRRLQQVLDTQNMQNFLYSQAA